MEKTGIQMKKIAVIGASGHLGSILASRALARGHEVTAIVPRASDADSERMHGLEGAYHAIADLNDRPSIVHAIAGHDAVIAAVRNKNLGPETHFLRDAVQTLLVTLPEAGVGRLIFLGSGASLLDATGRPASEAPWFPVEFKDDAREHAEALAYLRAADTPIRWSYSSPSVVNLVDGPSTGKYRAVARDMMFADLDMQSQLNTADYAAAILDALESNSFIDQRFAVGPPGYGAN